jgi:hypoxia up-regulated 1
MRKQIFIPLFLLFSFCAFFPQVQSAVMGVDFGSEYYKISMIAPGKSFVILENTMTHRKTHTAVSLFNDDEFLKYYKNRSLSQMRNEFMNLQRF